MKHFSISRLNMYLRCPAQYEFRYIDDLILPPSAALTKGRCVHKGAEHNYRQKAESRIDVTVEEVQDVVAGAFEREAQETSWEKGEDRGRVKDEALSLSTLYHTEVAPNIQPLFVEHEFLVPLRGAAVPLLGYIDVIDENLIIRDIKTASKSPSEDEAAKSLQLTAYAMAYREVVGGEESAVALDYLVQTKVPKTVTITANKTQADIDRLRAIISHVLAAIGAGQFYPNPSNFMCSPKNCGYWHACHKRYGGMTA